MPVLRAQPTTAAIPPPRLRTDARNLSVSAGVPAPDRRERQFPAPFLSSPDGSVSCRMRESELLQRIAETTRDMTRRWSQVVLGPGDDCAAVYVRSTAGSADAPDAAAAARADRNVLLLTVDQLVEGRHFNTGTPVELVARKAVARSISDIAAMGGTPRWALATGVLPAGFTGGEQLVDSLHSWGERWCAPIVGGDIAIGERGCPLMLTVTVGGEPHPQRGPVPRSGAKPGDEVWVTGAFGGSYGPDGQRHHLIFEPRVREGAWLAGTLGSRLHAMIDVSDGLGRDAGRIARASGVRIEIDAALVPMNAGVADVMRALADGEDYELCFAVEPGAMEVGRSAASARMTRIGRVASGTGCAALIGGRWVDVAELGWDHGAGEQPTA